MTALAEEVADLCWRYTEAIDEGGLRDWPECFTEDGVYRLVQRANFDRGLPLATMWCEGRAMMRDRVYALESANFYLSRRIRHVVGAVHVADAGEVVTCRAGFAVYETVGLRPTTLLAVGQYRDEVVRDADGALRFRERLALNESELVPNSLVFPI